MIAVIGRGGNILGALLYNYDKVERSKAQILSTQRIIEAPNGSFTMGQLMKSFQPYLMANKNTEAPVLHISLNPDPTDKVSDEQFNSMAKKYMEHLGYGQQPFVVFKHEDIERVHIHIVSVCVDKWGKKIDDSFEHRRSMDICRKLEQEYNLTPAVEKRHNNEVKFTPVDYKGLDIKGQIASVVKYLPHYYKFQTLGSYNALLSLFNITAEQVSGVLQGQQRKGLVYFALNEQGEKASNPFKASLFNETTGIKSLEQHFEQSKIEMKNVTLISGLKNTIELALSASQSETEFKQALLKHGINTLIRRNDDGRIYGMTFIDHESRSVWNGSALGKNLSANVFNDWWKEAAIAERKSTEHTSSADLPIASKSVAHEEEETHRLFDFLNKEQPTDVLWIDGLGSLLLEPQGEDYEEQAFANSMRKKKKRKRKL